MKIRELIKKLQEVENQDREVSIVIGNEDNNSMVFDKFELHNTDDNETSLEVFCFDNYKFELFDVPLQDIYTDDDETSVEVIKELDKFDNALDNGDDVVVYDYQGIKYIYQGSSYKKDSVATMKGLDESTWKMLPLEEVQKIEIENYHAKGRDINNTKD